MTSSSSIPKNDKGQESSLFSLLKRHDIFPSKFLGQVFLDEERVFQSILTLLDLQTCDLVVELGAGPGTLTKRLAEVAGKVVAIEIDPKFKPLHQELFAPMKTPPIIVYEDALDVDYESFTNSNNGRLIVFGNLPYYLTTELILMTLNRLPDLSQALFMVEQGVTERLLAQPGTKKYGTLAIATNLFGTWKLERTVSRTAFFPKPNVTSALLSLNPGSNASERAVASDRAFHRFLVGLMQYRRKTLPNALTLSGAWTDSSLPKVTYDIFIEEHNLSSDVRAEQLSPVQLAALYLAVCPVCQNKTNSVE